MTRGGRTGHAQARAPAEVAAPWNSTQVVGEEWRSMVGGPRNASMLEGMEEMLRP